MENPSASECATVNRSDNVRDSVCNGIGPDGERKHQRLREGTPGCQPGGTGGLFILGLSLSCKFSDDRTNHLARRRHQRVDLYSQPGNVPR